ncbi:hypothetical protein [uncultured Aquimarina sp.]|nr:hypothetical protein [uncultured Aquimarina sp.]
MDDLEEKYDDAINRIEHLESDIWVLKNEIKKLKVYIDQVIS